MTHDYKRNGTTTLFAALDLLQGKVIGDFHQRHRHQEFLQFLRRINREFPGKTPLHLVMDNYGTHSTVEVKSWLDAHPRFVTHFVPTSCSWLNLIERWFAELTNKRIRRPRPIPNIRAQTNQSLMGSRSVSRRLRQSIAHVRAQSCTRSPVRGTSRIYASRRART
jgi:transposase